MYELEKRKKGIKWIELIAAFYINSFVVLRPILTKYSYISSIILLLEVILMMFIFLSSNKMKLDKQKTLKAFGLIVIVSLWFVVDFIFRKNSMTWENYYYFIIYGMISSFWLIGVKDFQALLKYWTIFAIIGGIFLITDPFNRYAISGSYMQFGIGVLPAFAACVCLFAFYKVKIILPLALIFLVEIVIYASKGASIAAASIVLFFALFLAETQRQKVKRTFLIIVVSLIILIFLPQILSLFIDISRKIGVGSYSLSDVKVLLNGGKDLNSFNVRLYIWKNAWNELLNNLFLGMGIGSFEMKYGNYPHNFILDILVTHGLFFGSAILLMIVNFFKKMMKMDKDELFIFSLLTFLLWVIPSIFSFTYWKEIYFWVYINIGLFFLTGKNKLES